ncbi:MAG: hypothetical protein ABI863_02940 [Ginsengibacter sp.]
MNTDESTLIQAIQNFKKENPQYNGPPQAQLQEGRKSSNDYWYYIYFYYPVEDQIVSAWTRPSGEGKTEFAFVGINQGLAPGHFKLINRGFNSSENKEQKKNLKKEF